MKTLQPAAMDMDGIAGAGVRGADINGDTLDQYFLVRDLGRKGLYLVARVTGDDYDVEVIEVLVKPGDAVKKGQVVCVVDTVKAAIDSARATNPSRITAR